MAFVYPAVFPCNGTRETGILIEGSLSQARYLMMRAIRFIFQGCLVTILVTAFSAPEGKLNASEIVLGSLIEQPHPVLETAAEDVVFEFFNADLSSTQSMHESLSRSLVEMIYEHRPLACIFLGQAPGRRKITLERVATNYLIDRRIVEEGPVGYWTTLPLFEELPGLMEEVGVAAGHSNCAGSNLCNHVFYSSLHLAATQGLPLKCGFVHLPLLPEQCEGELEGKPSMELELQRTGVVTAIASTLAAPDNS